MTHGATIREKKDQIKKMVFGAQFRIIALCFIAFFIVLDVVQTSAVSTKGFEMHTHQTDIRRLEQENRYLTYKIATYRSMDSIQKRLSVLGMVPVEKKEFLFAE
ncbi:MAG: hypothetical protein HOI24_00760 [Candidatus Magasanikbacteria bacterium]|nr:hypothetical protein [Candidatus Magasanikbacteria bacterium]